MGSKKPTLPKSDGTTSTNYGPPFEISSTARFALRCCKEHKDFAVWINHVQYLPWDDIVAVFDHQILCVQLKHNEKLDKEALDYCLKLRKNVIDANLDHKDKLVFVYFTTSPGDAVQNGYKVVTSLPPLINLLSTNKSEVYVDHDADTGPTYFCMGQNNVSTEDEDVKSALQDYIGAHYLKEDVLKDIQIKFLEYMRKRYLRFVKGSEPLTADEIRKQLGHAILHKYKIEYEPANSKTRIANNLEEVMDESSVIVFDHRVDSSFGDHIWAHIVSHLKSTVSKKHLKQSKLNNLWLEGKLHMPITSPNAETDRLILRALEIAEFRLKVIILRPRVFSIRKDQETITILDNLEVREETVRMETGEEMEEFKYARVDVNAIKVNKRQRLHKDSFAKVMKDFIRETNHFPCHVVEAHDEYNFINDFSAVGTESLAPLFAAIRVKNIDLGVIKRLVAMKANVNAIVLGGYRPVAFAVEENRADILEFLLLSGADPNPADKFGKRPLFYACLEDKIDMVEILVRHNADRSASDVNGVRPLFMAYEVKNFEMMKILLKGLEKPAAANTLGDHILHQAGKDGSVGCLKCVLECCPNVNIFMTGDVLGKSPLDLARENGHQEFVEILTAALPKES